MKRLLLVFVLCLCLSQSALAEVVDKIVAKVGEDIITLSDVTQAVALKRAYLKQKFGSTKGQAEFLKFKENALDELILEKVFEAEIKKNGIVVTDTELEQEFKNRLKQYQITENSLIHQLRQEGISLADYKRTLKKELEKNQLMQKKILPMISISDYDLQKEYEKRKNEFVQYQKLRFIQAYLTPDRFKDNKEIIHVATTIQNRLKANQSAKDLIQKYSSGPFFENGGDSGEIDSSQVREEILNILSKLKAGETSPIMPVQEGIFIFKLLSKSDPQPLPFNKVVTSLRSEFGEKMLTEELRKYLLAVKDQMYVEIL